MIARTFRNIACFGIGLLLAAPIINAHAAASLATLPLPGFATPTPGASTYTFPSAAANQSASFPDALGNYATTSRFPIPTTSVTADIPISGAVDIARIPPATLVFLKKPLMVLAAATALYLLVCNTTSICHDSSGVLVAPSTAPDPTQLGWYTGYVTNTTFGSAQQSVVVPNCGSGGTVGPAGTPSVFNGTTTYPLTCYTSDGRGPFASSTAAINVPVNYPSAPATDTQIQTAVGALSPSQEAQIAQDLAQLHEPVPVAQPVISPVTVPVTDSTVVNRDAAGNPTGSTKTTQTATVSSAGTSAAPLQVSTVINTTTTNYDTSNNVTNSTTTTTNPAPTPDASAPTIQFDTANDIPVPTGTFTQTIAPSSWGEGTCPADPSFTASGHTIVLPLHVVCGAMSMLRPVVLLIASVVAGYILLGVKT